MTEQQILDKTIEYLNKYSTYFRNCDLITTDGALEINGYYSEPESSGFYKFNELVTVILRNGKITYPVGNDNNLCAMYIFKAELKLAYNIIKDLAQDVTDNPNAVNAAG